MKPWQNLSPGEKRQLWHERDPRVPPDWLPPGILPWDDCPYSKKRRLYQEKDPRVPPGWLPDHLTKNRWDSLTDARRLQLWKEQDPRVPPGWQPPARALPGRPSGFRTMQNPEAVTITLTPSLLAMTETEMWDYLERTWDDLMISPNRVIFRVNGLNAVNVANPRYKCLIELTTDAAEAQPA